MTRDDDRLITPDEDVLLRKQIARALLPDPSAAAEQAARRARWILVIAILLLTATCVFGWCVGGYL